MMERRKHRRFKSRLLITTVYRDDQEKIVTEDAIFSEDISAGGLKVVFPRQLTKGKVLDLKVFLFSDPIHLPAQGRVVWSNQKRRLELAVNQTTGKAEDHLFWVGIEFINIDFFTRQRILRWLRQEFNVEEA